MNKEKILQEEKEYWQAEALKARELVEQHAAATRKAREEIKVLEEHRTESICKMSAVTELSALCVEYEQPIPAVNYNTTPAVEVIDMAYDVSKLPATTAPEPAPEYILMAWRGNDGYYTDTRALSKEDSAKLTAIVRQKKVALYAKVVK